MAFFRWPFSDFNLAQEAIVCVDNSRPGDGALIDIQAAKATSFILFNSSASSTTRISSRSKRLFWIAVKGRFPSLFLGANRLKRASSD
jgi:hypothetical protein